MGEGGKDFRVAHNRRGQTPTELIGRLPSWPRQMGVWMDLRKVANLVGFAFIATCQLPAAA